MEKAYEKLMKQQALQKDELPRDLPRNRWPTAGERIDVLQEKLRATRDPARKLRLTAEIIAAREPFSTGPRRLPHICYFRAQPTKM